MGATFPYDKYISRSGDLNGNFGKGKISVSTPHLTFELGGEDKKIHYERTSLNFLKSNPLQI